MTRAFLFPQQRREQRAVRLAMKYNREPRMERRLLIRLIVERLDEESRELFSAFVFALGWKVWATK